MERVQGFRMAGRFNVHCACGLITTRRFAKAHGMCKRCFELKQDLAPREKSPARPTRNERILESGYAAYAREEE